METGSPSNYYRILVTTAAFLKVTQLARISDNAIFILNGTKKRYLFSTLWEALIELSWLKHDLPLLFTLEKQSTYCKETERESSISIFNCDFSK